MSHPLPGEASIVRPSPDSPWLREYIDGHSVLLIEHTYDGRTEISVGHKDRPGFRATFDDATAEAIADFIRSKP